MDCRDTERLIDSYLDRELATETARELESHLRDCRTCRERYAALVDALGATGPVAVPDGLRDRVVAALDAQAKAARIPAGRLHLLTMRRVLAIAASIVILMTGWLWWQTRQPEMKPPGPVVRETAPVRPGEMPNMWLVSSWAQSVRVPALARPATCLLQAMTMASLAASTPEDVPVLTVRRPIHARATTGPSDTEMPVVPYSPAFVPYLGV